MPSPECRAIRNGGAYGPASPTTVIAATERVATGRALAVGIDGYFRAARGVRPGFTGISFKQGPSAPEARGQ